MDKTYNDLNKVELYVVREYNSWKKSECPIPLKIEMLEYYRQRATKLNIIHILNG